MGFSNRCSEFCSNLCKSLHLFVEFSSINLVDQLLNLFILTHLSICPTHYERIVVDRKVSRQIVWFLPADQHSSSHQLPGTVTYQFFSKQMYDGSLSRAAVFATFRRQTYAVFVDGFFYTQKRVCHLNRCLKLETYAHLEH